MSLPEADQLNATLEKISVLLRQKYPVRAEVALIETGDKLSWRGDVLLHVHDGIAHPLPSAALSVRCDAVLVLPTLVKALDMALEQTLSKVTVATQAAQAILNKLTQEK